MGITGKNSPNQHIDGHVTVADIAHISGVNRSTLYNWRNNKPKLYQALELAVRAGRVYDMIDHTLLLARNTLKTHD